MMTKVGAGMLSRLRFENWRSLRHVVIEDLTPITVFIGANSAGKSNIIDGLYFLREAIQGDPEIAMGNRGWEESVRTLGASLNDNIVLEIGFKPTGISDELRYTFTARQHYESEIDNYTFWYSEKLTDQSARIILKTDEFDDYKTHDVRFATFGQGEKETRTGFKGDLALPVFGRLTVSQQIQSVFQFISERWQLLDEFFNATPTQPKSGSGEVYGIDRCADNLPAILRFMQTKYPALFDEMQAVFKYLVSHVDKLETTSDEHDIRMAVREKHYKGTDAPTISAGTGRLLGILAAYYALDMRTPELPGLVVLEEPDMAVHPLLFRRLVDQLRNFTEREEYPRQFILTTHNPALLNLFKPKEIRIVERDSNGETSVRRVHEALVKTWQEQTGDYNLGDLWTTRLLGGVPE